MLSEVGRYEQSTLLSDSHKVALRLHRAFLSHPAGLDADVRAEALMHFSSAQIVELVFKFMWWSTNRASVTLGEDRPHDATRLTSFRYDETGAYVVEAG